MDYHLFLGEDSWGPITVDTARDFTENKSIYRCDMCSNSEAVVYHSVFGLRRHATKEQLRELLVYVRNVVEAN
jgi:hypothetical protein